jgi:hypothetical protein
VNLVFRDYPQEGPRHYLAGEPVHCGTLLRLLVASGGMAEVWVWARYEMSIRADHIVFRFHTLFGVVMESGDANLTLRWPREDEL